MNNIRGIAASGGYGIGNAVVIRSGKIEDFKEIPFTGPENEKNRLNGAVDKFLTQTHALAEKLKKNASEKESRILLGHCAMIQDPFIINRMREEIDAGAPAEKAAEAVCNMFIDMFSAADDELTNQRVSDIQDIRDRLIDILSGRNSADISSAPENSVLIAKDFTPSMTSKINKNNVCAIVAEVGGVTSHSAILARAMGIPAVLSVTDATHSIRDGETLIVDGLSGKIFQNPSEAEISEYQQKQALHLAEQENLKEYYNKKTATKSGIQKAVYGNIGKAEDAQNVIQNGGEGIGLFRTEFLFMDRTSAPDEEEQFEAYATVAKEMNGKEVIIRTLDIGGDKEIPYLSIEKEDNPFLGHRAIRFCLDHTDLFKTQIKAILRAAVFGKIKMLLPLITTTSEVDRAKELTEQCCRELKQEGKKYKRVPIGVMIETPAAALISNELAKKASFFSIGTNDLTGYIMAVDRGNKNVCGLYDVFQPPVLKSIEMIIKNAKAANIPVGMCGEAAANRELIPLLLEWGLDEFSVSPSAILQTRRFISQA